MILGDPTVSAADGAYGLGRITISELFHYAARRRPDALALADPANRGQVTDGKPRRLSYAEADRVVAAIAARLRGMGLSPDAVIGIQLPNVVENILAILGVLRAGMIAKHMLRYPTHSGSRNRRIVVRTGNRCAAFKPCQRVIALTLASQEHRRNTMVIQQKERRFLPA